jgi:hypothetical protein
MSKVLRAIVVAIAASIAAPADAGDGRSTDDLRPPPASSDPGPAPDDDGPVLPPWERPGADEPEAGVDDDPTTFDPAAGPTDPLPD